MTVENLVRRGSPGVAAATRLALLRSDAGASCLTLISTSLTTCSQTSCLGEAMTVREESPNNKRSGEVAVQL